MPRRRTTRKPARWKRRSAWVVPKRRAQAKTKAKRTTAGWATPASSARASSFLGAGLDPLQRVLPVERPELLGHRRIGGCEQPGCFEERLRAHGEEFAGALRRIRVQGQRIERGLRARAG